MGEIINFFGFEMGGKNLEELIFERECAFILLEEGDENRYVSILRKSFIDFIKAKNEMYFYKMSSPNFLFGTKNFTRRFYSKLELSLTDLKISYDHRDYVLKFLKKSKRNIELLKTSFSQAQKGCYLKTFRILHYSFKDALSKLDWIYNYYSSNFLNILHFSRFKSLYSFDFEEIQKPLIENMEIISKNLLSLLCYHQDDLKYFYFYTAKK